MHEFSIVNNIVDIAIGSAEQNGLKTVSCVEIEVGKAAGIEPSAMEFAWESARQKYNPGRCQTCDALHSAVPGMPDVWQPVMRRKNYTIPVPSAGKLMPGLYPEKN